MKIIPLTKGQIALVDDEDFERFGKYKWYAYLNPGTRIFYARRNNPSPNRRTLQLHREILGLKDSRVKGDHKNHDTLDCRRENLRSCTQSNNMANRIGATRTSASGIRGVCWDKGASKWRAHIRVKGKRHHLDVFIDKSSAAEAYSVANKKHFGEFGGIV